VAIKMLNIFAKQNSTATATDSHHTKVFVKFEAFKPLTNDDAVDLNDF